MTRVIMHVDMDAFYSSVEQRENLALIGKPVIVGAEPQGGKVRGVVMGCSYEARKFGVRSAMPISIAFRLCPGGIYLRPNFALYESVSEQVMAVLRRYATRFEQVSIDEAYLDVTDRIESDDAAKELAIQIKASVRMEANLSCSIGVAPNKALAKIASDIRKPDGLTILRHQEVQQFLAPLSVSKISGIGKKSTEILGRMGILTIGQLASTHPSKISDVFGKYGVRIWQIANGIDDEEIVPNSTLKSISSETTFNEDVESKAIVEEGFQSVIEEVLARVQSQRMLFRTVGIKVRLENFDTLTRAKTNSVYTNKREVIEECVRLLFREFENSHQKIRLVGVRVSGLRKLGPEQESILSWTRSSNEPFSTANP